MGSYPMMRGGAPRRQAMAAEGSNGAPDMAAVDFRQTSFDRSPVTVDLAGEATVLLRVAWLPSGPWLPAAVRRMLDFLLATVALVLTAPLLLGLIAAVRISSPGPALFRHRRVGRYGVMFDCWKLRTMYADAEHRLPRLLASDPDLAREFAEKHKLERDPRITPLGRWLRILNLDELPQLWNIVRGDMSLVGPRPIVTEEIPRYGSAMGTVLSVRPGLTGLWQVSGRSETSYEERVSLDLKYVTSQSFWVDLKILAKTVVYVFRPSRNGAC